MFLRKHETYFNFKSKITPKESNANFIPKENVMYTCRALLQIQSVFFKIKDKKDVKKVIIKKLLSTIIITTMCCKSFINNAVFHPDLEFTDTKPESESESEEEINESTVLNE